MSENKINAEKITKPIQLLAAWLIGLILLVSALLTASGTVTKPDWLPAFFAISAVAIIPVFLLLIFLLQTKYRPEMQEDSFYSKYLDKNTMTFEYVDQNDFTAFEANKLKEDLIKISENAKKELEEAKQLIHSEGKNAIEDKLIESLIDKSDNKLDELKKILKFSTIELRINKKLPKYEEITKIVQKIGFNSFDEFGKDKNAPAVFLASFDKNVPLDLIKEIIFELIPCGLTYIKRSTIYSVTSTARKSKIILGSYAIDESNVLVDENLINKLNSMTAETKFIDLFR
jgi:hypothetical protein